MLWLKFKFHGYVIIVIWSGELQARGANICFLSSFKQCGFCTWHFCCVCVKFFKSESESETKQTRTARKYSSSYIKIDLLGN